MTPAVNWLKPSRYNAAVDGKDGNVYVHNLFRGTSICLEATLFESFDWICSDSVSQEIVDAIPLNIKTELYGLGFLVDDNCNEVAFIKNRYYETVFSSDVLQLVILPSLWCNLDCPYCFENKRAEFMTDETSSQLKEWVTRRFSKKRYINIGWFGGEPLLGKERIRELTGFFQKFCAEIGARYTSSITTNGFYLDKEFAGELRDLSVKHVQITFDGDRKYHDQYRKQRNGNGSFDQIYRNIIDYYTVETPVKLTVRVNCTDENVGSVPDLLSAFPEHVRCRTNVFFRWVWANKASGYKEFSKNNSGGREPFRELARLYDVAASEGWIVSNPVRSTNPVYCEVDFRDHFTVAPNGDLFLCTHTFDSAERVGSLSDYIKNKRTISTENTSAAARWMAADCFGDPECLECKVLPICKGGCRKARVGGQRSCVEEKYSLDEYVMNQARASGLI